MVQILVSSSWLLVEISLISIMCQNARYKSRLLKWLLTLLIKIFPSSLVANYHISDIQSLLFALNSIVTDLGYCCMQLQDTCQEEKRSLFTKARYVLCVEAYLEAFLRLLFILENQLECGYVSRYIPGLEILTKTFGKSQHRINLRGHSREY